MIKYISKGSKWINLKIIKSTYKIVLDIILKLSYAPLKLLKWISKAKLSNIIAIFIFIGSIIIKENIIFAIVLALLFKTWSDFIIDKLR